MAAGFIFERRRLARRFALFLPVRRGLHLGGAHRRSQFHEPWAAWLKSAAPWTRGQIEYLFLINAGIYFLLDRLCDRFSSPQVRIVGKSFRFVIPGHVMTSLLLLGLSANTRFEARLFEWLLPSVACVFVFASIPRQMKNFFVSGLVFLAIGVFRLQQDIFREHAVWPVFLLASGLAIMLAAAHYAPLKVAVGRWLRRI